MFGRNSSLPLSLLLQAERQARIDGLVVKARMHAAMRNLPQWLSALRAWRARRARALADERRMRNAIGELHQLDDRALADIGIARCGIEFAVRHGRPHAPAIATTIFADRTCDGH
jgi:uncharacterized protein YjiS (DUF1127 family)